MLRGTSKDPLPKVKMASLFLGTVVLGFGLYSHFTSAWVKKATLRESKDREEETIRLYSVCSILKEDPNFDEPCPNIAMERYFVAVICINFVLSIFFFLVGDSESTKPGKLMRWDAAYHLLGGLALIAGAIVYMTSAMQIRNLIDDTSGLRFRYLEKRIASSFAIIQAAILLAIARLIARSGSRNRNAVIVHPITAQANLMYGPYPHQQNFVYGPAPPPPYHVSYVIPPPPEYTPNANSGVAIVTPQPVPPPVNPAYGFTIPPDTK